MKKNNIIAAMLLCAGLVIRAQSPKYYLLNLDTITYHGTTDTLDYMPIQVNTDGNVIISGNQKVNTTQYDATTASLYSDATLAWVNSFNSSTLKYFIAASTHDAAGNIYNVGAARVTTNANGFDFFTQKLTSSGSVIWTKYYNGPNSTIDVATAVALDAAGNVYVTGASEGIMTMFDYATVKYNSSGTQVWVSRYNYSSSIDIPTKIEASGSNIIVSGSSGTNFLNYDFATVRYSPTSGSQVNVTRTSNPNASAQDQVCSMATDNNGNVFIVGTTLNGGNYDVKLQKLDTALNVLWTQTFNGSGFDDAGINLETDSYGNVYVTGSSYTSVNGTTKEMIVLKYSPSGVQRWVRKPCKSLSNNSVGVRLRVKNDNEIFVGGNTTVGGSQDIVLLALDSTGNTLVCKTYGGAALGTDKFMDMTIDGDRIFVSARSYNGSDDDNIVLKYRTKKTTPGSVTNAQGLNYEPNTVIVHFNKKALKMNRINNRNKLFGNLNEFIADSTCDKISQKLDPYNHYGINAKEFKVEKIFHDFIESDTVTQSRLGDYVRLHDYYTHLLVFIPSTVSNTTASNQIKTIKPDITTTELNYYLVPATNDPNYAADQGALHPTGSFPNGHINWDSTNYIASGESFVKVGVFDTGIDFGNPDYSSLTQKGFNFVTNAPFSTNNMDDSNHGTAISGVIAAAKNNNIGIAGIAGRDAANPNNQGVDLYDCKVCANFQCLAQWFQAGLLKGIQSTQSGGFGLNVINMSINLAYNYFNYFPYTWGGGAVQLMNDANRLGVALAGAKGNGQSQGQSVATYIFPADYNDRSIMSVGSTGENGHHCIMFDNCSNASTIWGNIDFSAPGTKNLVMTLDNLGGFMQEDGTSIATPHVSGANALMMSYFNAPTANWNNMDHEDCERILERTCTDLADSVNYYEGLGYDTISGWGRINVTKALKVINKNYFRFRHITGTVGSTSITKVLNTIATGKQMSYDEASGIASGLHSTDIVEVTTTLNYNLLPTESIIDAWPMYKECYGARLDTTLVESDRPNYSEIVSVSNTQAVLKTYYYKHNATSTYFPYFFSNNRSAITLYTYDSSGSVGVDNTSNSETNGNFKLYPNPNNGVFNLSFETDKAGTLEYRVIDVLGRCIGTAKFSTVMGENDVKINISDATAGVYYLTIFDSKGAAYSKKVIKN